MSFYDFSPNEPEKSYHLFILGLLVLLSDKYAVRSNRESGFGRYDIMLIPHGHQNKGIVIEFKKVDAYAHEILEVATEKALEQIVSKDYAQELCALDIRDIIAYGIAFEGKQILVKSKTL